MSDLEKVLKDTLARASSHTRNVYGKNPLTIQELLDLVTQKGSMSLAATVKPDGQPHLSPIDVVSMDGRVFLGIDKATARYKNLQKNPRLSLITMDGWKRQAILEGHVRFVEVNDPVGKRVGELQKKKYGWRTDSLAELTPEKVYTYKSSSSST